MRTSLSHFFLPASLVIVLSILGTSVIAAPIAPPPGGYTGGIFSYYFKNIIEGDGTVGTTSGGICPAGRVISGFSTASGTYGLPICIAPISADGSASSLTGSLRGTTNYVPKYGLTNTGIINSQIYDNGTNIGIGTSTGTAKLTVAVTGGGYVGIRNSGSIGSQIDFNSQGAYIVNNGGSNEILGLNTPTGGNIAFRIGGTERFRLHSNGNVGIGTAAPAARLAVVGTTSNATASAFTAANASGTILIYTRNDGNIGIGTSTPSRKLDVVGGDAMINGVLVGKGSGSVASNTAVGTDALLSNNTGGLNTAIGYRALYANTIAGGNTAVGNQVLYANTTGGGNTAIGYRALYQNSTGSSNTANGVQALMMNSTGSENTANGRYALYSNRSGNNNAANGVYALYSNTTGNYNTANGHSALYSNTTGIYNTANGDSALYSNSTGSYNTANGGLTLRYNTTGYENTANGFQALMMNTTGRANTANGMFALMENTTGTHNVADGWLALGHNTIGSANTANGEAALYNNTVGNGNTANGGSSLFLNITGNYNTANGNTALYNNTVGNGNTANGYQTLYANTTGQYNTAEGYQAGLNLTSGDNNIALGANTNFVSTTGSNQLNIGNWIYGDNGNIGIGTGNNLTAKLTVAGTIQITGGSPGAGKFLVSDANGLASWSGATISESDPKVGALTTNYLPKWAGSTLGNSQIFDNGTNVGIGENNPDYRLTLTAPSVTGSQLNLRSIRSALLGGNTIGGIIFTSNDTNLTAPGLEVASIKAVTAIAHTATNLSTELVFNTTSGTGAVEAMRIREDGNVGIGVINPLTRLDVLGDIRVDGLTVGKGSGSLISNTAIGRLVLAANTTGTANTGIGNVALDANTTGINNTAIGVNSLTSNTTGNYNVGVGVGALANSTTGDSNVAVGVQSLTTHTVGTQNTALGHRAAWNQSTGDNNIAIGYNVSLPSLTSSNQLNIGNWVYGNNGNIGIGTGTDLTAKLTVQGKVKISDGTQGSGKVLFSDGNGLSSWGDLPPDLPIGTVMAFNDVACPSGWAVADGTSGTPDLRGEFVRGLDMGRGVDTGRALGSSQSGTYTLQKVIDWAGNDVAQTTAVQHGLGLAYASADTEATASGINTPIGAKVPNGGTYTAGQSNNIALGGFYSTHASGEINGRWISYRPRNVALLYCMKVTSYSAPLPLTWYNTTSTSDGDVALGTTGNVGVGTATPTEKLEVAGSIKIVDGNQGTGKILVSDAVGKGTWQDMPGDLPIGTVMAFNDVACPSGWVIADGTSGTPDLRGEFVRGLDMGRGVDTGRALGTAQEGSIYYGFPDATPAWSMTELSRNSLTTLGWEPITGSKAITYRNTGTATANTAYTLTGANAAMVRSRNVALLYCMKVTVAAPELSNNVTWMNVDGTSSGRVSLATTGNVGIGTATPTEKLEVAGNVKIIGNVEIIDGYQGAGKVLVSDNGGKGTWQEMPGDLPTGSIMAFNSASCPAGWVMADGTPGTPDLRGEFVRGLDMGRSIDTGRTLASAQDQDWKGFYMRNTVQNGTAYAHENVNMGKSTTAYVGNIFAGYWSSPSAAIGAKWDDTSEIRPRNVALLYCMKISASPATESNSGTWMNIDGTSSGRVVLATTGNVGIGTVNPTSKFETTGGDFKMSDAGTIDTNAVRLFSSAGNLYLQNGGGNNIYFRSKTATNTMTLSNSGTLTVVGSIYANAFYYNSDIFLKKNIKKLESSLEKIQKLNGYSFDWKKTGKSDIGVIAQEVEKVFPALVGETTDESGEIRKTVQYGNLIAPIIEAIKELASQVKSLHTLIEEQQSEIRKLQTENAELRGRIEAIEKALSTNKQ